MSPATNQILQTLAGHRDAIRAFGARRLGLFGSQARGEATAKSDLDFLVELEPGTKTFDNYMDLASGAAARLAGVPRVVFLSRLADCGVDTFRMTAEDLQKETRLA